MSSPEQEGGLAYDGLDDETREYLAELLDRMAAEVRRRTPHAASWTVANHVVDTGSTPAGAVTRELRGLQFFRCDLTWPEETAP